MIQVLKWLFLLYDNNKAQTSLHIRSFGFDVIQMVNYYIKLSPSKLPNSLLFHVALQTSLSKPWSQSLMKVLR